MAAIGAIDVVGPLPNGVKPPSTTAEKALYEACKSFEAVFARQIVDGWMKAARGDDAATGGAGIYQSMADEQMTRSLVDGGSFGLAGTLYGQLAPTVRTAPTP